MRKKIFFLPVRESIGCRDRTTRDKYAFEAGAPRRVAGIQIESGAERFNAVALPLNGGATEAGRPTGTESNKEGAKSECRRSTLCVWRVSNRGRRTGCARSVPTSEVPELER